ncbi:MAG TPA: DUF3179 domain-containing protein, partial [Dehalococcoidia bacterium]|nr:DUF3179 domain-containing protein [Dehalococcoidia bacterium]
QAELREAGINTSEWRTDFSQRIVPYSEFIFGGPPKDGIPSIDNPKFISVIEADQWLADPEPVQMVDINGDARAYPLQILMWHEIVNDIVADQPVAVTYCPLCNTALVFNATLPDGRVLDFGVTGMLRFSDLVMYDRQTESWWQQITGEAIVGELTGTRLEFIPSPIISWSEFKAARPDGRVLSRDTGFRRPYGENPYTGYDSGQPWLFSGSEDDRLQATERVATVSIGDVDLAFPFSILEQDPVVHYQAGKVEIVVFYRKGTVSALDSGLIAQGRDVGSTGVFIPKVNGQPLTFEMRDGQFQDRETGSRWNLLGEAVAGPLKGETLEPVVHGNHFWFSWAVFKPDTIVYRGG